MAEQPAASYEASPSEHFFAIHELAHTLPTQAKSMLRDLRLVENDEVSCRVIRIYKPLPLHFHVSCDENVYVLEGRALFQLGEEKREIAAGMFVQFPKGAVHGVLELRQEPFLVLTIDTPRRPEDDVVFLDPAAGDAQSFHGSKQDS